MSRIILVIGLMILLLSGCKKSPECEDGFIPFLEFGCERESDLRKYIFFEARPSFYCYNDYTVLALNLEEWTDFRANPPSRIYNNSFYYINPKLENPRGGTRSFSLTQNEGLELCYASPGNDTPYYTHLRIRDPEKIQVNTQFIQVNLLLKETSQISSATIDSTVITMNRIEI
ncbi:MAG: hypothetical protein IPM26_01430 [Saprospiraceae bacterium]|nr:hypothetical protein [Saprospiraceae bacterium]